MASYNGALNKDAFISMVCQQSRAGTGVDARWCMQIWSVSKATAISILNELVTDKICTRAEVTWRGNAKKFYWYPTDEIWKRYHAKEFRVGYKRYTRAMWEVA